MFDLLAALALGYLLGGVPTAAIAARIRGKSIFELGSGNMGAMNSARSLGWVTGVVVALVDVGKGALGTYLGLQMAEVMGRADASALLPAMFAATGAVLGHAYSPYVHFEGGKAIATTFGITLPLAPLVGLYYLGFIVALYLIFKRVTLAGLVGALLLPVIALLLLQRHGWPTDNLFVLVTGLIPVALIGAIRHVTAWVRERSAASRAEEDTTQPGD